MGMGDIVSCRLKGRTLFCTFDKHSVSSGQLLDMSCYSCFPAWWTPWSRSRSLLDRLMAPDRWRFVSCRNDCFSSNQSWQSFLLQTHEFLRIGSLESVIHTHYWALNTRKDIFEHIGCLVRRILPRTEYTHCQNWLCMLGSIESNSCICPC